MTKRLENAVNQIKQYQLCYHCDYYDEDNMHCTAEDVNCVETIANQIGREIYNKALDDFADKITNWKSTDEEYRSFEDVVEMIKKELYK